MSLTRAAFANAIPFPSPRRFSLRTAQMIPNNNNNNNHTTTLRNRGKRRLFSLSHSVSCSLFLSTNLSIRFSRINFIVWIVHSSKTILYLSKITVGCPTYLCEDEFLWLFAYLLVFPASLSGPTQCKRMESCIRSGGSSKPLGI